MNPPTIVHASTGTSVRRQISAAFRDARGRLTDTLIAAAADSRCGMDVTSLGAGAQDEYRRAQFTTVVDLTGAAIGSNDALKRDLLIGWINAQIECVPSGSPREERRFAPAALVEGARRAWLRELGDRLSPVASNHLDGYLRSLSEVLSTPSRRRLRALFIGDCFVSELSAALVGPCVRAGIALECQLLHERVPARLRNEIRTLDPSQIDIVFFSPYTHTFLPGYAALSDPRAALWDRTRFFLTLDEATDEAQVTAQTLADQLSCSIYLHNTAAATQTFGRPLDLVKHALCSRNARQSAAFIREKTLRQLRARGDHRIRLIDEVALLDKETRWSLGENYFSGELLHPTRLGLALSRTAYLDAIFVIAYLASKKVVVCDLDNTLWDGVIGEGRVSHFSARQRVLKGLRGKGVLLSINSKNDPRNVSFEGGELSADDFVAARINWRQKSENMANIVEDLNLKVKDFVFIDDRPDERERIQSAFPDMIVMDATDPGTWRQLEHWERFLDATAGEDRTRLYHERAARTAFLSNHGPVENESEALARLGLRVRIETVERSELPRIVELVNRTNQFNLGGTRTTVAEMEAGLGATHHVLRAVASDKFGSMGVVGAMRVDVTQEEVSIPIFVLSCRVFGFGIEYALLNTLRRLASPGSALRGTCRETPHNGPCREFYPTSGLRRNGGSWEGTVQDLRDDPAWLMVERAI